jgi:hypothetical protein
MKKSCIIFILLLCSISDALFAASIDVEEHRRQSAVDRKSLAAEIKGEKADNALQQIDNDQYLKEKEKTERATAATRAVLTKEEADQNNWEPGYYIDREGEKRPCERYKHNHKLLRRPTLGLISRNHGRSWIKEKKPSTTAPAKDKK